MPPIAKRLIALIVLLAVAGGAFWATSFWICALAMSRAARASSCCCRVLKSARVSRFTRSQVFWASISWAVSWMRAWVSASTRS